jgi:pimeloyl-ACP methyl ester carboxylesterase
MLQWGMEQHRADIRSIVQRVQAAVQLPYDVLGHSYGAASALDYAAAYPGEARRAIALDIYSFDPFADPASVASAALTRNAYDQLMSLGVYADATYNDFGALAKTAFAGKLDAGLAGSDDLDPYTSKQLLLLGMIYSWILPGIHTPITGLPGDWPLEMGALEGDYLTGFTEGDDDKSLGHTRFATLRRVSEQMGGGVIPMAFARDYWSIVALDDPTTRIRWQDITSEVIWLNSELGYGDQSYGAELIRAAGNEHVKVGVVEGYGHQDMIWGDTARRDVWQQLSP